VRVIAATNRNLAEAIQKGRFRLDLYYRLNVYPIQLPPLRERVDDIELLANLFVAEAARRLGRTFDEIPRSVIEALRRYEWPGNVRELQNVIERAAVTSTTSVLQLPEGWAMPLRAAAPSGIPAAAAAAPMSPGQDGMGESTLQQFHRKHILEVLNQTGWRIEGPRGAAVVLGLNPSTLRSRMQKLGIQKPKPITVDPPQYRS
jgi:formate hydrogenlyase transcriptional activator